MSETKIKELEISNPSDELYISDEDHEAACGATLMLGGGSFGLKDPVSGELVMPIFLFGGCDLWWEKTFDHSIQSFCTSERGRMRMSAALETVRYARERTSMNDIGHRAKLLCDHLKTCSGIPGI